MPHCTLPFAGTRYSLVYFTNQSCENTSDLQIDPPAQRSISGSVPFLDVFHFWKCSISGSVPFLEVSYFWKCFDGLLLTTDGLVQPGCLSYCKEVAGFSHWPEPGLLVKRMNVASKMMNIALN